jgi:DNA polymerase-3 subunit alpha
MRPDIVVKTCERLALFADGHAENVFSSHLLEHIVDYKAALKELNIGKPDIGVFQFDGYAMAKGGRKMKVRSVKDAIIAGGLFRPAVMDASLDDVYIERRNDKAKREAVRYPHPVFKANLESTYGIVVFQEQVINIMRGLGMTYAGINTFFDAVKDSASGSGTRNAERFDKVYKEFTELCKTNGITDVEAAWSYVEGYVRYGFNLAHASGYGVRSYRGAYLKAHYPLEYMTSLLEVSVGHKKESNYIKEARRIGLRVMQPDVNLSGMSYTIDRKRGAILRGMATVKGVGVGAAEAIVEERDKGGQYTSIENMIERLPARPVSGGKQYLKEGTPNGVLGLLLQAGVLDSITKGQ